VAHYHRYEAAGAQATSMRRTLTFRSLRADFAALRAAAPPGVVDATVESVGMSEQGRDLLCLRLGKNPASPVLIAGCHHAREWISVEVPFLIADFLVHHYGSDDRVRRIVDSHDIWIVPLINPDGHERSVLTSRMWRTNFPPAASGRPAVDLNRNYATARWNIATGAFSDTPGEEDFRGPSSGFAREVQAMQTLIVGKRFKGTLDFHSFGRWVLFPWAGRTDAPPNPLQMQMARDLERVADLQGVDYEVIQASGLYPELTRRHGAPAMSAGMGRVPGGMQDFVLEKLPGSIAITVELDPDWDDVRAFVLPESEIEPSFDHIRGAILTFLNCVDTLPAPAPTRAVTLSEGAESVIPFFNPDCSVAFERV
jgi:carboxypeptidase T